MRSVGTFIKWRKSCDVSPEKSSQTYGIAYDDPNNTEPAAFRFDICGSTTKDVPENPQGVLAKRIPGGRCARVRHVGSTDALGPVVNGMYTEWLPESGEQFRDFPCYFHYVTRMPTCPDHQQITDIYLPLA